MTDETEREALAPCPFCGGEARHGIVEQGGETNPDFGGHFVQCTNESCSGCMGLRFACGDDPKPDLTAAWNRRVDVRPSSHRCPIGLDDNPTICSAGSCASCLAWRAYVQEIEARHRAEVEAAQDAAWMAGRDAAAGLLRENMADYRDLARRDRSGSLTMSDAAAHMHVASVLSSICSEISALTPPSGDRNGE